MLTKKPFKINMLFPAGRPVTGDMLVGRGALLNELTNIIGIGQSVILVAPRRYGKTSVALELLKIFKQKGYFVGKIDLFNVTDKKSFSEKIIETCLENNPVPLEKYWNNLKKGALNLLSMLKFRPADEDIEVMLQLGQPSANEDAVLDRALDFPEKFCSRHDKQMIIFIDEFQEIIKIGGELLLKKTRAKMQHHKNVVYVFAGSQESLMTELFQHKQHAFYRFGRLFEIGIIEKNDFIPYIEKSFKKENIKISHAALDTIFNVTRGHPYYTQLLCQMIYINCLKVNSDSIDVVNVNQAEESVIEHESAFYDELWKELGDKKFSRNAVKLIACGQSPYSNRNISKESMARVLNDLIKAGCIFKIGSAKNVKYDLKDPFFKKYIFDQLC